MRRHRCTIGGPSQVLPTRVRHVFVPFKVVAYSSGGGYLTRPTGCTVAHLSDPPVLTTGQEPGLVGFVTADKQVVPPPVHPRLAISLDVWATDSCNNSIKHDGLTESLRGGGVRPVGVCGNFHGENIQS